MLAVRDYGVIVQRPSVDNSLAWQSPWNVLSKNPLCLLLQRMLGLEVLPLFAMIISFITICAVVQTLWQTLIGSLSKALYTWALGVLMFKV